ncbi:hypothetical protein CRM22_007388 [Opisthorchis felineus]|uniref:Uncharacterized protein n=1 Tax=Opisthorchis felineus TaxID=147828 RepID=A0A4V3SDZ2_OPIFE|nr:hypothetical protein CRM22_007388 [Opisthorchis felineus]
MPSSGDYFFYQLPAALSHKLSKHRFLVQDHPTSVRETNSFSGRMKEPKCTFPKRCAHVHSHLLEDLVQPIGVSSIRLYMRRNPHLPFPFPSPTPRPIPRVIRGTTSAFISLVHPTSPLPTSVFPNPNPSSRVK